MIDLRRGISPVVLALALIGCNDSTKPIDLRVGLFVAGENQLSTRLHHHSKSIKEGELRGLDKVLKSAITKACRRVFASVDALESDPTQEMTDNEELDFIVIAKLMGSGGSFGYEGATIWNRGESDYSLSVLLNLLHSRDEASHLC